MNFNDIWLIIEPYIAPFLSTGALAAIAGFIAKFVATKMTKKVTFDTSAIADKLADKLVGNTLKIDLTHITDKRFDKLQKDINKGLDGYQEKQNEILRLLTMVGTVLAKSKTLTDDERKEFIIALKQAEYLPPLIEDKDPLTLVVTTKEETAHVDESSIKY